MIDGHNDIAEQLADGHQSSVANLASGTAAWPDPSPWFELGDSLVLALDVRDGTVRWSQPLHGIDRGDFIGTSQRGSRSSSQAFSPTWTLTRS